MHPFRGPRVALAQLTHGQHLDVLEFNGNVHALAIDLHDIAAGRPFVGNRRYENARGNGETWLAN
jgi:hypothetical protein